MRSNVRGLVDESVSFAPSELVAVEVVPSSSNALMRSWRLTLSSCGCKAEGI